MNRNQLTVPQRLITYAASGIGTVGLLASCGSDRLAGEFTTGTTVRSQTGLAYGNAPKPATVDYLPTGEAEVKTYDLSDYRSRGSVARYHCLGTTALQIDSTLDDADWRAGVSTQTIFGAEICADGKITQGELG